MRKLTQQTELEALKERCTQASQANALMVLSTNNVETHTDIKNERIALVVGGSHFLDLEVGGLPVRALVDTGSPATIISEKLLHKIMKGNTEITPACLERPTVQLVDCGQHLLHIVGQITLTFKFIPEAERKVKVLINTTAHKIAYLGPMLKKNLVSLWHCQMVKRFQGPQLQLLRDTPKNLKPRFHFQDLSPYCKFYIYCQATDHLPYSWISGSHCKGSSRRRLESSTGQGVFVRACKSLNWMQRA